MDISRIAYMVPDGRIAFLILLRASCGNRQPYNILTVCMQYHCPTQLPLVKTSTHSAIQSLRS